MIELRLRVGRMNYVSPTLMYLALSLSSFSVLCLKLLETCYH